MIWSKEELMSREEISAVQEQRIKNVVERVYQNVPFYREKFMKAGVEPGDIKSLEDITKLPFTTKEDLRDNFPYGMFAVSMDEVVRLHASSGTTGKPTIVGYTSKDIDVWTEVVARMITCAGVNSKDIVQIAFGYGLFTGAFGLHYGAEKVGAAVIPASAGNTERQLMIMRDFGTTVLVGTPTYALHMAETADKMGILGELKVRLGLFGAEGCSEEARYDLEKKFGIKATDNYGLSEIIGPGVSGECQYQKGLHINEDHFLVEVLDSETLQPVKEGEKGELVITTLTKEALPVLRYRTKDVAYLMHGKCDCGRFSSRMSKVLGRTDDMLIIRGVNVFPSQVESVLLEMKEVEPHYQLIVTKENSLDNLEVKIEVSQEFFSFARQGQWDEVQNKIEKKLKLILSLKAKVTLVTPGSLERFQGKARRVFDLRHAI